MYHQQSILARAFWLGAMKKETFYFGIRKNSECRVKGEMYRIVNVDGVSETIFSDNVDECPMHMGKRKENIQTFDFVAFSEGLIGSFVANEQYLDGPFILNEMLNWCKRKKKQAMFFKVDFAKAYDSVRWDYLLDILHAFGFGPNWCRWIRGTFTSSMASILVNGSPTSEFPLGCGFLNRRSMFIGECQVLGVGVSQNVVVQAANRIGCAILNTPFRYLGVTVGECKFFNGVDSSDRKISWVAWDNVLASKLNGGLGVSSFFALNRALLLKWVWRFISGDGSLWCKVIQAIYGSKFDLHVTDQPSIWCSILREVKSLKDSGFDFSSHCKKRIGDGSCTSFWYDIWLADAPLCVQFPRLFALELDKEIVVANKMGASSVSASFRRDVRDGAERCCRVWDIHIQ
ncbi:RNA-directed DNA polymerase, eukaryota [Tanacetum coccineum]